MPYLLFYACEHYEMSGILALVACGLYMAKEGKTKISVEAEHSVHAVWHYIGFTAETVIFGMTGLILGEIITKHVTWSWIALLFGLYFLLHVIRFGFMLLVMPILNLTGYEFNLKHCIIVSYGGLRGAVGLALALIVTHSEVLPEEIGIVTVFNISGIVLLTLVINGTTTGFIIKSLGLKRRAKFPSRCFARFSINTRRWPKRSTWTTIIKKSMELEHLMQSLNMLTSKRPKTLTTRCSKE